MEYLGLRGEQYVRLAPDVARAVAPYVGVAPAEIEELLVDLDVWPNDIQPEPRRGRDGRLIAGDPELVDANEEGLVFASRTRPAGILIPWNAVTATHVLRRVHQAGA